MAMPRLEITDRMGRRVVPIEKSTFLIGRREGSDLRPMEHQEVSRDHAEIVQVDNEIVQVDNKYVIRDRGSRKGTFVNDEQVTERELQNGDRVRLGRTGGVELVFLVGEAEQRVDRTTSTAIGDLRLVATLLEGLSALGSGRILEDVLALVLDAAIEAGNAERGFIMLADSDRQLEFKLARSRGRTTLPGDHFETSRKIPEQVFTTGQTRIVSDLLEGDLADVHRGTVAFGIRHVLCVPLRLVQHLDREEGHEGGEDRRIGVLYLDSRERGTLLSSGTRGALETLATEAAVAIENARLYRLLEKAKLDQDMRVAAEIQQALLPKGDQVGEYFGAAATSLPSRFVGGDFFDYARLSGERFGFVLGDVAGKGPSAALLSAMVQGIFATQTTACEGPGHVMATINEVLCRRGLENRFVTVFFAVLHPDGTLHYCNAGHNAPFLVSGGTTQRLEVGGPIVGLFEGVAFDNGTVTLAPGDSVVVFSDGVSEAQSSEDEEFGEGRIEAYLTAHRGASPKPLLDDLLDAVRAFTAGAPQSDDVTAMVVQYTGSPRPKSSAASNA